MHCGHSKGFSFVWDLSCRFRCSSLANDRLHVPQTCGLGLSVLGGGKGAAAAWDGSGLAVWTDATIGGYSQSWHSKVGLFGSPLPLLAPLEPLLELLDGPIVLVSASADMLDYGAGVASDLVQHTTVAGWRPERKRSVSWRSEPPEAASSLWGVVVPPQLRSLATRLTLAMPGEPGAVNKGLPRTRTLPTTHIRQRGL